LIDPFGHLVILELIRYAPGKEDFCSTFLVKDIIKGVSTDNVNDNDDDNDVSESGVDVSRKEADEIVKFMESMDWEGEEAKAAEEECTKGLSFNRRKGHSFYIFVLIFSAGGYKKSHEMPKEVVSVKKRIHEEMVKSSIDMLKGMFHIVNKNEHGKKVLRLIEGLIGFIFSFISS
jgi:hypothetical protein